MDRHRNLALGSALVAVLVLVAACGGRAAATPATSTAPESAAPAATGAPGGPAAVTLAGFAFDPASITVAAGTTVAWANTDSAAHTVRWDDGTAPSGSLTSGGAPYTRTFDAPGTFTYACGIHPAMTGTVIVEP